MLENVGRIVLQMFTRLHKSRSRNGHQRKNDVKRKLRETALPSSLGTSNVKVAKVPALRDGRMTVDRIINGNKIRRDKTTSGVVFAIRIRTQRTFVTFSTTSVQFARRVGTCLSSVHNILTNRRNNNNDGIRRIVPYVTNTVMWANIVPNGKTEDPDNKVILHQIKEGTETIRTLQDDQRRRMKMPLEVCLREIHQSNL